MTHVQNCRAHSTTNGVRPKICERIKVLTLTDDTLIHTGQRVNPLSDCAFIASLQAELRITLATTLAPCLNWGYIRILESNRARLPRDSMDQADGQWPKAGETPGVL
jgi:hypothetical protein